MGRLRDMYFEAHEGDFDETYQPTWHKEEDLRYGENPGQPAALYDNGGALSLETLKSGKQGLSATNLMDLCRGTGIVAFFGKPACAVMKHAMPSGFAVHAELCPAYRQARDADQRSAFGSVVVCNREVDDETAEEIARTFVELVAAPSFSDAAVERLSAKKDIRLIRVSGMENMPRFSGDDPGTELLTLPGGKLIRQASFLTSVRGADSLVTAGETREPSQQELQDLLTAWYVNIGTRSNGIVIVKNGVTIAVSGGQQERVGAVEQAILKAYQKAMDREGIEYEPLNVIQSVHELSENPLAGACVSSDGFFPFRDSIDLLARQGVAGVVQPGGSRRDSEVSAAAREHSISMLLTKERCFGHF